jgi:hypothetical protein
MSPASKIVQSITCDITIRCCGCSTKHTVQPTLLEVTSYWNGGKVQHVWSDESPDYREVMIGYRTGWFICPACNEPNAAKEDFNV